MDAIQNFVKSNPWIEKEKIPFSVKNIHICEDISKWKTYDVLLSTDKNDHFINYNTVLRILEVMPQNLNWDGRFVLGLNISKDNWRNQLKDFIANKHGKLCFLNFEKHKLTKSESQIYIEKESEKKQIIETLLQNAILNIENKEIKFTMSTSPDPVKNLKIGIAPNRCDVLVTRSEFIDAIPASCLQKYVKENGVILHFGRLLNTQQILTSVTYIDAAVLPKLETYNTWARDLSIFLSDIITSIHTSPSSTATSLGTPHRNS